MNKQTLWIVRTAIFLALLVVIQIATAPLGITLITGSLVNLILIMTVMTCGLSSGLVVAVISPFLAKLVGIGPLWVLIPFIALGNCGLVLIWQLVAKRAFKEKFIGTVVALVAGAAGKFLILYLVIVRLLIPLFLNLPAKQAATVSATFSLPQLATALIGGAVAVAALPAVKKARASRAS
ncbi:hypothetical protein SAMN02745823_00247 [Sporobacter termitidis DSM 10068]|uniref:ECF transporter S component n=1 Tax=Sporobacter termitidis DSM 10068 TaxID=1123282 RepID=A0A1M5TVE2_9FIRM|nr:ECF transporter S component [Sporobacter termitidis]SHH54762.1 hypothetical protein SAMN02745823_00247 [Sporobacter termitidis DSM 10068]